MALWDGTAHRPLASEGGHADFAPGPNWRRNFYSTCAPNTAGELRTVLSGPGLRNIYRFLRDSRRLPKTRTCGGDDPGRPVGRHLAGRPGGELLPVRPGPRPLHLLYGAEAGNLALRSLATGGVYVGGGIAPKIIARLQGPAFMHAFTAKGRLSPLLETIPVRIIRNERTALLGAGRCALLAIG